MSSERQRLNDEPDRSRAEAMNAGGGGQWVGHSGLLLALGLRIDRIVNRRGAEAAAGAPTSDCAGGDRAKGFFCGLG